MRIEEKGGREGDSTGMGGEWVRGLKKLCSVCVCADACVCVHLHVCLSQLCHSSEQQNVEVALLHVFCPKLSHFSSSSSSSSTASSTSSSSSCLFQLFLRVSLPVCQLTGLFPISVVSFTHRNCPCLLPFLILSHPFARLPECLSPSPLSVPLLLSGSLSFSHPPNQSHMLEKEAGRSDDGQDCVVCGAMPEPTMCAYACKKSGTHACICARVRSRVSLIARVVQIS